MSSRIKQIRESTFIRHNAIFFVGSLVVGVLNYAFYPVIGRLLPISTYGEVQILISLFTQLALFLAVLNQVTVNIVATRSSSQRRLITYELEKLGIFISIGLFLLAALSSKFISTFFRLGSPEPFLVMLLAFLVTVPLTFRSAYLRGMKKFWLVSLVAIIGAGLEIAFSAGFVLLGFGAVGALSGLVLSQAIAYVYASYLVRKSGSVKPVGATYFTLPNWPILVPELKYSLFVLVLSLFTTLIPSIDILAVKHYFNPHTAGLYAGVSIVARSVLYVTGSLAGVLLPLVSSEGGNGTVQSHQTLLKSLALLALIGGGALLIFALFPRFIITLLMGHKYLVYAHLLPELSLAMFLISIINMLIVYFMALREYWTSIILVISSGIVGGLMLIRHHSVAAVVSNLAYSSFIIFLLFSGWVLVRIHQTKGGYAE